MSDYVTRMIDDWATVQPETDTAPLAVVTRLLRAAQLLQQRLDNLIGAEASLSHKGDLDTLTALRRSGGVSSPTALAAAVQVTSGGMTNRLDRLETAGLVERQAAPGDRRSVLVSLTSRGEAIADDAFAASLGVQQELINVLSDRERTQLATTLERLLVALGDVA